MLFIIDLNIFFWNYLDWNKNIALYSYRCFYNSICFNIYYY